MRLSVALLTSAVALGNSAFAARDPRHVRKPDMPQQLAKRVPAGPKVPTYASKLPKLINSTASQRFSVNGSAIPEVDFDIGESYAGLLPISPSANASELYFWFFPSHNPDATDEILIWLNGGPGCSSLEGLLQENGPFLWQYGTFKPVQNPYTWVNLTNVVWIEQPAGTGFSKKNGDKSAEDEVEVAKQFLGFWKNFVSI